MTLDLRLDAEQQAIADAVTRFCRDRASAERVKQSAGAFPRALWDELAALGFLALGTPEGGGGALEVVALVEPLGHAAFPGPVAETFLATQLVTEPERAALAAGRAVVSAGAPPLLPWAPDATIFLELGAGTVFRAEPRGAVQVVETLGGERWGRVALERGTELPGAARALVLYDLVLAAYLAGAGRALVLGAAEHARGRVQFGRPIGSFQAVAHPLADAVMRLDAAAALARVAAFHFDHGDEPAARKHAVAARLSARAASLAAAYACHQTYGGIGITLEGPAFHVSRRIRQLASAAPGLDSSREALLSALGIGGPS